MTNELQNTTAIIVTYNSSKVIRRCLDRLKTVKKIIVDNGADKILNDSNLCSLISERYKSFDSDYGKAFEIGELGLEELRELSMQLGNPQKISGKQELFESIINNYI